MTKFSPVVKPVCTLDNETMRFATTCGSLKLLKKKKKALWQCHASQFILSLPFVSRWGWRKRCMGQIWWSLWTRGSRWKRPQLWWRSGNCCADITWIIIINTGSSANVKKWYMFHKQVWLKCDSASSGKLCVWDGGPPAGWKGLREDCYPHSARVFWTWRHKWSSGECYQVNVDAYWQLRWATLLQKLTSTHNKKKKNWY